MHPPWQRRHATRAARLPPPSPCPGSAVAPPPAAAARRERRGDRRSGPRRFGAMAARSSPPRVRRWEMEAGCGATNARAVAMARIRRQGVKGKAVGARRPGRPQSPRGGTEVRRGARRSRGGGGSRVGGEEGDVELAGLGGDDDPIAAARRLPLRIQRPELFDAAGRPRPPLRLPPSLSPSSRRLDGTGPAPRWQGSGGRYLCSE
ncbi:hypothetical protein C2845_PM13G18360 [Panicum miliaceum]|uniref:Uncharacterized protein n=1 Tax=Panicum miliaceum TaxID=4540 RepID=A0A3L6RLQ0_PANMI|nr:hypothetical protein C2845_PM13G18360 [Panicum miliaceum]